MNSLRDVIRLRRAGHGSPLLRKLLWQMIFIVVVGLVAMWFFCKATYYYHLSGMPTNRHHVVFLSSVMVMVLLQTWNLARIRRLAIAEALKITRANSLCRGCFYPLIAEAPRCSECGLDPWGPTPPPPSS